MNKKSFDNLSFYDIKKIEEIASEMLTYYGYPLLSKIWKR